MSLMGMDIGSTGAKAVVFDLDGNTIAECYREYRPKSPNPGWQELDAEEAWAMISEIIKEANQKAKADPVTALAASAMGESMVFLDENGDQVHNAILNFDNRTIPQAEWWEREVGREKIFQITGMPLYFIHSINKIMWIRDERPKAYSKLRRCLCFEDFVYYKLGVEPVIDHSLAARTMAFDVTEKEWSDEMIGLAGIERSFFPEAAPSGTVIGEVDPKIADELGFQKGVKVVTGGHDQPSTALGAGIIQSGIAVDGIGTVECITPVFDKPILTKSMLDQNYCIYPHTAPGLYCTVAFNFTGGSLLKWYRDNFGCEERQRAEKQGRDVYDIVIDAASEGPSPILILPHFTTSGTPYFDAKAKGAVVGLTTETTKGEFIRAILEGVTFEIKHNIEILASNGVEIRELRATGGGSKSARWLQIKADIYGRPVASLNVNEAGCLGCAALAGAATGGFSSIGEALERMIEVVRVFEPDSAMNARYEERFQLYKDIYPSLCELHHRM
jgi:xylulokinase